MPTASRPHRALLLLSATLALAGSLVSFWLLYQMNLRWDGWENGRRFDPETGVVHHQQSAVVYGLAGGVLLLVAASCLLARRRLALRRGP